MADQVICPGCSGHGVPIPDTGGLLFTCDSCGGLLSGPRGVPGLVLRRFIAQPFAFHEGPDPDDVRYFDVDVVAGVSRNRVHGWFSPSSKRVTQFG